MLELGTTEAEINGSLTVDVRPPAKLIHDLRKFPWPLPSDHFRFIIASHIIEHIPDTMRFMEEIWRISKPNAKIILRYPHYTSAGAFEHPTHSRYFSLYTFSWFAGKNSAYHTDVKFRFVRAYFRLYKGKGAFLNRLANISPVFFERHLAWLFGVAEVICELEVIK